MKRLAWFKYLLFLVFGLFLTVSLYSCGGGGGGSTGNSEQQSYSISGQALLGPLAGSIITISTLDGKIITQVKADNSSELGKAGIFTIKIPSNKLPSVFLISASGGVDIDPFDNSSNVGSNNFVSNLGTIHEIVFKSSLNATGKLFINPLSEMLYESALYNFSDNLSKVSENDLLSFLNKQANSLMQNGNYNSVLTFNPLKAKNNLVIHWSDVYNSFIKYVHMGISQNSLMDKAIYLMSTTKQPGSYTMDNGSIQLNINNDNGTKVISEIYLSKNHTTPVGFKQLFKDNKTDSFVTVNGYNVNDNMSYYNVKVNVTLKNNDNTTTTHTITIQSIGNAFYTKELNSQNKSINDNPYPSFTPLVQFNKTNSYVVLDVNTNIGDNPIIYIDGKQIDSSNYTIENYGSYNKITINTANVQLLSNTAVNSILHSIPFKPDPNTNVSCNDYMHIEITSNGSILLKMPTKCYSTVTGMIEKSEETKQNCIKELLRGVVLKFLGVPEVLDIALEARYLLFEGIPVTYKELSTMAHSIDIEAHLFGTIQNGYILPGNMYIPVFFVKNRNDSDKIIHLGLNVSSSFGMADENTDIVKSLYTNKHINIGYYEIKANSSYVIIPPEFISVNLPISAISSYHPETESNFFSANVYLKPTSDIGATYSYSYKLKIPKGIYTNYNFSVDYNNRCLHVDASPSQALFSGDYISEYKWLVEGNEIEEGKTLSIPFDELNISNGYVPLTLKTVTSKGMQNSITKLVFIKNTETNDTQPPSIPTNLQAVALSDSQIKLSWNPSTDNVGVEGYNIYDESGDKLTSTGSTSYIFSGLSPDTQYCYQVAAYDKAGNESDMSQEVCATTGSQQDTDYPSKVVDAISTNGYVTDIVTTPDGKYIYVNSGSVIDVIQTSDNKVIDDIGTITSRITLPPMPSDIAITPDGKYVYALIFEESESDNKSKGIIDVIRTSDNKVINIINIGNNNFIAYVNSNIAITPDGKYVYIDAFGTVDVIRTSDNKVIKLDINVGFLPTGMVITPDSKYLYISNLNDVVYVIRTSDNKVINSIDFFLKSLGCGGMTITPNGKYVYAAGDYGKVYVIRTSDNKVIDSIIVSSGNTLGSITITPNGKYVYVSDSNGTVYVIGE